MPHRVCVSRALSRVRARTRQYARARVHVHMQRVARAPLCVFARMPKCGACATSLHAVDEKTFCGTAYIVMAYIVMAYSRQQDFLWHGLYS